MENNPVISPEERKKMANSRAGDVSAKVVEVIEDHVDSKHLHVTTR